MGKGGEGEELIDPITPNLSSSSPPLEKEVPRGSFYAGKKKGGGGSAVGVRSETTPQRNKFGHRSFF